MFALVYLGTNRLGPLPAGALPVAGWENAIPFLPWTVFGYALAYLQILPFFFIVRRQDVGRAFIGMSALLLIHGLVFLLFPTAYPRPPFPHGIAPIIRSIYDAVVFFDAPRNCFPSLHAALSFFATFVYWRKDVRCGVTSLAVSMIVLASALTLKQHYAVDIVAGGCTAVIAYALVFPRRNRADV